MCLSYSSDAEKAAPVPSCLPCLSPASTLAESHSVRSWERISLKYNSGDHFSAGAISQSGSLSIRMNAGNQNAAGAAGDGTGRQGGVGKDQVTGEKGTSLFSMSSSLKACQTL